jgi:hypothetical protein
MDDNTVDTLKAFRSLGAEAAINALEAEGAPPLKLADGSSNPAHEAYWNRYNKTVAKTAPAAWISYGDVDGGAARAVNQPKPIPAGADMTETLANYGKTTVAPSRQLDKDVAQLKVATSDPDAAALLTVARDRGNDLGQNQVLDDYEAMKPWDFALKYGAETTDLVDRFVAGGQQVRNWANQERTGAERVRDDVVSVGAGFGQAALSTAALASRLHPLGKNDAVALSEAAASFGAWTEGLASDGLTRRRAVQALRAQLDASDDEKVYEQQKKELGPVEAEMNRVGRDVIAGAKRLGEDGMLVEDLVAQGLGSMLVGGPVAKGLSKGAIFAEQALGRAIGVPAAIANRAAPATARAIQGASFPAAIGLMEGGGAYMDSVNQVLATPDAELQARSPAYAEMRKTMSEREAKVELGDNQGLISALIAAPIGAATAGLVGKIERAPLVAAMGTRPAQTITAMGREFSEEGMQGGGGQVAQNVGAVVSGADPDRAIGQGVGEQMVQGAVAGGLSAGVLKAPGTAVGLALAGPKAALRLLEARGEKVREGNEAGSEVSTDRVRENLAAAREAHPELVSGIRNLVERGSRDGGPIGPEQKAEVEPWLAGLERAHETSPEQVQALPESLRMKALDQDGNPFNAFEAAQRMAEVAIDERASPAERMAAAAFIDGVTTKVRELVVSEPAAIKTLREQGIVAGPVNEETGEASRSVTPEQEATLRALDGFRATYNEIRQTPAFRQATDWAVNGLPEAVAKVDPKALDTTTQEGKDTVAALVQTARTQPQAMPAPVLEGVLQQAKTGRIALDPAGQRSLEGALALARAGEASGLNQAEEETGGTERSNWVTRQINEDGGQGQHQWSLKRHAEAVTGAVARNDLKGAKAALSRLGDFATSMANKVEALNQSIRNGDGKNVAYQALGPDGRFLPEDGKQSVGVIVGNDGSERFARQVQREAVAVARLHNELAERYPGLGLQAMQAPELVLDQKREATPAVREEVAPAPATNPNEARAKAYEDLANQEEQAGDKEEASRLRAKAAALRAPPAPAPEASSATKEQTKEEVAPTPKPAPVPETAPAPAERQAQPEATVEAKPVEGKQETRNQNQDPAEAVVREEPAAAATEEKVETPAPAAPGSGTKGPRQAGKVAENGESTRTADRYPNLVGSRNGNWFTRTFKLGTNKGAESGEISRLARPEYGNPLRDLARLLAEPKALLDLRDGNDLDYDVGLDERRNLYRLISGIGGKALQALDRRLQEALAAPYSKAGTRTQGDLLVDPNPMTDERIDKKTGKVIAPRPTDPLRSLNMLTFNLVEKAGEGYRYQPQLAELALLAGLDYVQNGLSQVSPWTKASLAESLKVPEDAVSDLTVQALNLGLDVEGLDALTAEQREGLSLAIDLSTVKRGLARHIAEFWGVQADPSLTRSTSEGIPEAMAAEVLSALAEAGLLTLPEKPVRVQVGGTTRDYGVIRTAGRSEAVETLLADLEPVAGFIGDMALVSKEPTGPVRAPVTAIPETQLRNPLAPLTEAQKAQVAHENGIVHKVNLAMAGLMGEMPVDLFRRLMGGSDLEAGFVNETHQVSLDGKNKGLVASYAAVRKHVLQVLAHAAKTGLDPAEVPSHYAHQITKVGRAQMVGEANPQGDKLAREIFTPNRSVIDLTNEAQADLFWLAVGQALGLKTEYLSRKEVRRQAEEKVASGKYREAIDGLKAWLGKREGRTPYDGSELPIALQDSLERAFTDDKGVLGGTMHLLHGLVGVAESEISKDPTRHVTHLYLEADGKTNGPMNALMLLGTGRFTQAWLDTVRKGGVFVGAERTSLNDYWASGTKGSKERTDLYQAAADALQTRLVEFGRTLTKQKNPVAPQLRALARFAGRLGDGLSMELNGKGQEVFTIGRGFAKNPLTITGYGSGIDGIAGKIADGLIETLLARMTQAAQEGVKPGDVAGLLANLHHNTYGDLMPKGGFAADLERLFGKSASQNQETGEYQVKSRGQSLRELQDQLKKGPVRFQVTPEMHKALKANVRILLANPLNDAIDETFMGHVRPATQAIQTATQIQSAALKAVFLNAVVAEIRRMRDDPKSRYIPGQALSPQQEQRILDKLKPLAPLMRVGDQAFAFAGGETSEPFADLEVDGVTLPKEFARSLTGKLSSYATLYGPTLAGVRAVPSVVIGTGDGQMQLEAGKLGVEGVKVFDGTNMAVDRIERDGTLMNEAARRSWLQNPLRGLAESFKTFVAADPVGKATGEGSVTADQFRKDASDAVLGRGEEVLSDAELRSALQGHLAELERMADEVDARIRAIQEHGLSVDQMASAESPYVEKGSKERTWTDDQALLDSLNASAAIGERTVAEPQAQPADGDLTAAVEMHAEKSDFEVRVTDAGGLRKILNAIRSSLDAGQKELFRAALPALERAAGYTIAFGRFGQLMEWEYRHHPDRADLDAFWDGKYDSIAKTLMISNGSVETLLHEMIHVATYDKLVAHYEGRGKISQQDAEAIVRIEGLMHEWLAHQGGLDQDVRALARSVIQGYLNQGSKAAAVNEFMAWVLANQELARDASRQTVFGKAYRILKDAARAISRLVFGKEMEPGSDLLSQLRFNTRILMASGPVTGLSDADVVLHQSAAFGTDQRLTDLRQAFEEKVALHVRAFRTADEGVFKEDERAFADAALDRVLPAYELAFPGWTMQQAGTFRAIVRAFATTAEMDPSALSALASLHAEILDGLTVEDFLENRGDPDQDRAQAQEKYDALRGLLPGQDRLGTDLAGRSTLLSGFLALHQVDARLREAVTRAENRGRIDPDRDRDRREGFDARLAAFADGLMERLGDWVASDDRSSTHARRIDALADRLAEIRTDERTLVERAGEGSVDRANDLLGEGIRRASGAIGRAAENRADRTRNRYGRAGLRLVQWTAGIVNREESEILKGSLISAMNQAEGKGIHPFRELALDVVGRSKDSIADMSARVKTAIDAVRQQYREELPRIVAGKFRKAPSKEQWTALHRALGQTDLGALVQAMGTKGALAMFDQAKRQAETARLEAEVRALAPKGARGALAKARQLGDFLVTGNHGQDLLTNAEAIAARFLPGQDRGKLADALDRLASLYAVDGLDKGTLDRLAPLLETEGKGVSFALAQLASLTRAEREKAKGTAAELNGWKGLMPQMPKENRQLVVALDSEHAKLLARGFTRVGAYAGSPAERGAFKRSYYYAPVSGLAAYSQGVMHIAAETAQGADPVTGHSLTQTLAGRITDRQEVRRIQLDLARGKGMETRENLRPVFNAAMETVAYERMLDPRQLARLEPETGLHTVIGAWTGRIAEEELARASNRELVERVRQTWQDQRLTRKEEFVDLSRVDPKTDPVLAEAWRLIPLSAKRHIQERFGTEGFMVRRDMVLDGFGVRNASVGDMFTGNSRWSEGVRKGFEDVALGLFGNEAYRRLVTAERMVQGAVANAKTLIVVKSVIVPAANMVGNMLQLTVRGVPVRQILRDVPRKVAETNAYVKLRAREIQAEAELRAAQGSGDLQAGRKAEVRIQGIKDAYRRMSIWPLIEAGQFSSISNGLVAQEDLALAEGGWGNWAERLAARTPTPAGKFLVRYGLVTKDTALYAGLNRATQYGDFVAKAVLYDHLTKNRKVGSEEAIADVRDEFVDYSLNAGRSRQYLESVGLMWFYHYKLRTIRVAARTLRDRPLSALIMAGIHPSLPLIGNIGTPVTDNLLGVGYRGNLEHSLGPWMGLGAMRLNPWMNLAGG